MSRWALGDPWARLHALLGAHLATSGNPHDRAYVGQTRLTYLETIPGRMLGHADGRWMLATAALALIGGLLFPRRVGLFTGWFMLTLALLLAVGGVLHPENPSMRLNDPRYWMVFLPPMVLAAVGTVATAAHWVAARLPAAVQRSPYLPLLGAVLAAALLTGPLVGSAKQVQGDPAFVVTNHGDVPRFIGWVRRHPEVRRIVTDVDSRHLLGVFTRSFAGQRRLIHVRFVPFSLTTPTRPGDYLVLFSAHNSTCGLCRIREQSWLAHDPKRLRNGVEVWHR